MYAWYQFPLDRRAHRGGETGVDGVARKGGEFLPFYVPRPEMPQVEESDYPRLMRFASQQGAVFELCHRSPSDLKFHQRVGHMDWSRATVEALAKPLLVSGDGFVLDGNHRATFHKHLGSDAPVICFSNLEFEEAIRLLFAFPATESGKKEGE